MWHPEAVAPALETSQVEARPVRQAKELMVADDRPTVFLLDAESRSIFPVDIMRSFVDAGGAIVALGRNGETDVPDGMPTEFLSGFLTQPTSPRRLLVAIRAGFREAAARAETARARGEAAQRAREIGELTRIGVALGTERDIKTLLDLILTQSRRITQSDAGSLYLVETNESGDKRLRFKLAQTLSKPEAPFVEHTIPVDRGSLAGYCAVTGDPLVIDDAYFLAVRLPHQIDARDSDEGPQGRDHRRAAAHQSQAQLRSHPDDAHGRRPPGGALLQTHRRARHRPRRPSRGRHREQPALRRHREAVRRIRPRGGARDRAARSDDLRPQRARSGHDGGPGRGGRPGRGRAVSRREVLARAAEGDPLCRPVARLRQGRRARAGAHQSEKTVPVRPRPRASPPRVHPAHGGARILAQARRVSRDPRQGRLRQLHQGARSRSRTGSAGAGSLPRNRAPGKRAEHPARRQLRGAEGVVEAQLPGI